MRHIVKIAFLLNLIITFLSFSREGLIGNNIYTPVLVTTRSEVASGFYFGYKSNVYFITARHVLLDDSLKLKEKEIMLTSNSKKSSNNKQDIFKINLTKVINTRYLLSSRNFDIASIEIATNKESILYYRDFVTSLNSSGNGLLLAYAYLPYDSIAIPDDCFILGYPKAIGIENFPQIDFNKPLLRKGIIAGKNEKNRTIILDCPVYYGNSGGPAFEYYIDENGIIPRFYLIGVVTEFVPYVEKWCNLNSGLINSQMSNSGYSVVEPIDKILELIDKQK